MKDKGLVLSTQDTLAKVEVECFTACGNCSAQSLCLGQSASKGHVSAKNPLHAQPGDTVSLLPLGGDVSGITTEGLKYPLNNEELTFGPARGISNRLEKPSAHVKLSKGLLLAVHTPGRA